MFTLRHIEASGHESIHYTKWLSYDPGEGLSSSGEHRLTAGTDESSYGAVHFGNGTVYVMNENGKTVAKYDLDLGHEYHVQKDLPTK